MKIYVDKNGRITGYEITFYDPKGPKPNTNLDTGQEVGAVFLTHEENRFVQNYLEKGGKVTDLIFRNKVFTEDKIPETGQVCGFNLEKTILIDIKNFSANYEINRHLADIDSYIFREVRSIPMSEIRKEYLYASDLNTLEQVHENRIQRISGKRFFRLEKGLELAAFIFIITLHGFPRIVVLYHNELYSDAGYCILYKLIQLLKKEDVKHLDLGGLTKLDSGINQFKKKWGKEILMPDVIKKANE